MNVEAILVTYRLGMIMLDQERENENVCTTYHMAQPYIDTGVGKNTKQLLTEQVLLS